MVVKAIVCVLTFAVATCTALELKGVTCQVHKDIVVDLDPVKHRYYPYVVKLPRCVGAVGLFKPNIKKCVPKSSVSRSYKVLDVTKYINTFIDVTDHTDCTHVCVHSPSSCHPQYQTWNGQTCTCDCKYRTAPMPSPCEYPKIWQSSSCQCMCPTAPKKCSDKKEWSEEDCACMCKKRYLNRCSRKSKVVSQESCTCIEPVGMNVTLAARGTQTTCRGVENKFVVMIVVIEFLCLTFIFFMIYRYAPRSEESSNKRKFFPKRLSDITLRRKKQKPDGNDVEVVRPTLEESPLENGDLYVDKEHQIDQPMSVRESKEEPVGFYYAASDVFGSVGNVSVESTNKVTVV